jgi:hypothetical protein
MFALQGLQNIRKTMSIIGPVHAPFPKQPSFEQFPDEQKHKEHDMLCNKH